MDNRPPNIRQSSRQPLLLSDSKDEPHKGLGRHTLGLILLLIVVFLWTTSSFLGSSIFADNTYAKPFFLTYFNTSLFIFALIPALGPSAYRRYRRGTLYTSIRRFFHSGKHRKIYEATPDSRFPSSTHIDASSRHLDVMSTARLSFMFCILWFAANYFAMTCLKHTTVASATVLVSTSSIWTLLIGTFTGTERFTYRKLLGVLASLLGIVLVSRSDLSSSPSNDTTSNTAPATISGSKPPLSKFPSKTPSELALGDALALFSAILYGLYTITLKRTTLKASPRTLNMPLFFGLVGLFNALLLFPLFPVLHYTSVEPFAFPPTKRVWTILGLNGIASLCGDILWAYAMVLTSPLVVTVGLGLTIPLSLIGEMVLQGRYEGVGYWIGAGIVVGSFVFVDQEERIDESKEARTGDDGEGLLGADERELERGGEESESMDGLLDR